MIKVKFNGSTKFYDAYYVQSTEHVCKLLGDVPASTKGFKTYMPDKTPLGDKSEYNTVFKVDEDGVMFSDDGSVYSEEIQPDPDWNPTVSIEERVSDLEDAVIELAEMVGE